jgi:hypothetical protein
MSESLQKWILRVSGAITMLALLQWIVPDLYLHTNGLSVDGATGMLFARHWGLVAFVVGWLLFLSASRPAMRIPVVTAALIEKAGLVLLVVAGRADAALDGLRPAAAFDTVCVLCFAVLLAHAWRRQARNGDSSGETSGETSGVASNHSSRKSR